MHSTLARRTALTLVAVAGLGACGSTPPSQFYVLAPIDGAAGAAASPELAVFIQAVRVTEAVDRPQIVTVEDSHERRFSEFSRWAEPLPANIAAVLAENLGRRLGTERVSVLPTQLAERPDVRVTVDVVRFDATLGGPCRLVALWSLRDGESGWIDAGRTEAAATADGDGYGALARAMSECVAQLSGALAEKIGARARPGGG